MIDNSDLETILSTGDDFSVVVELYAADAAPPFDPSDALLRYASVSGISFAGETYARKVKRYGRIKRTIDEQVNTAQTDFDNLDNEISDFEFATGFEGLIKVVRLISRSRSDSLTKSLILFAGRCERPDTGNRESMSLTGKQIIGAIEGSIPRRRFSYDDAEGRPPQDPNFEGFRFMPQYGTVSYSLREKRGGLLGLFGLKKTVTITLQYSSYSDLDESKFIPVAFGRVQMIGTHVAYADIGTTIRMTTAFCEGKIQDYTNWRTDDPRFTIFGTIHKRMGYPPNQGPTPYEQIPIPNINWVGNGYYARTAMMMTECFGTNVQTIDPAPGVIVIVLGTLVTKPDSNGDWILTDQWSDNAAAHTRFLLTSDDYFRLDDAWLNDESFYEAHRYNDEIIFDSSYSDLLFLPDTASFSGGDTEKGRFLASTALCTANFFKYLNDDVPASTAFLQTPLAEPYAEAIPIEPPDPGDELPGGTTSNLTFFLRRRYTSNVVVSEQTRLADFLHKILFVSSRLFLTQDEEGRLKLNHKKPVDWALATAAVTGTTVTADDVSSWIADNSRYVLIDPHTSNAEVRVVSSAAYSAAAPALAVSANLSKTDFTGGNGTTTPNTATITAVTIAPGTVSTVTIDGTEFSFTAGSADTIETAAGFIYGTINAHPILRRKFSAAWSAGTAIVTVTQKNGTLTFTEAVSMTHAAPLSNPSGVPTIAGASGGSFEAGVYRVAYAYKNSRGETLISPAASVTLTANQKIDVTGESLPAGATAIRWYCSPAKDSLKLRFVAENTGSSFSITTLPRLTASVIPEYNRTGAEIMRVQAVFSDRAETRSSATRSNVLKATYKWRLGNRAKPTNHVELKYRDSTQDFRLLTLNYKDDAHIDKIKKANKKEVNGQAIDNYHQAYRIAAGILAEELDADFFYEWASDRTALLLEEGDVVCITDSGSGVVNFPVRIESNEYSLEGGFPKVNFTARKYATTLYDDSVAERQIPVIVETGQEVAFVE